jgi:hypothetical protein
VRNSRITINHYQSQLPAEAQQLRTLATDLYVNGALSSDPKTQSAMFGIADRYERTACLAQTSRERFLLKDRLVEMLD